MTEEKRCPACGKPTAGYVPCPHCGADPRNSITLKFAAVICVIILGFGAVFYLAYLTTSEAAPTAISSIDSWIDYSYVWVNGVVSSGPNYGSGVASFEIYDNSAERLEDATLPVEYYDPVDNTVPTVGDQIMAFGQLRAPVGGDKELRISFPSDIQLTRAEPVATTISDIMSTWDTSDPLSSPWIFKRVTLTGTVTGVRPLSSAKIYTLTDGVSDIELYVHNGRETLENRSLGLNVLDVVTVTSGLSQYSGSPQLVLASFDELQVVSSENAPEVEIQSVNENMIDNVVRVGGKILFVETKGSGSDLEFSERVLSLDNIYNPNVSVSEDLLDLMSDNDKALVKRGTTIELVGDVQRYGSSVRVAWVGPQSPTLTSGSYEPPSVDNFLAITSDNLNELVTITGSVTAESEISVGWLPSHWLLTLQDNLGGSVSVYLPNFLYERMESPPAVGDTIEVVGKVTSISGHSLVVQPGVIDDVQRLS